MVNFSSELYTLIDVDGSHIVIFMEWLCQTYQLPTNQYKQSCVTVIGLDRGLI